MLLLMLVHAQGIYLLLLLFLSCAVCILRFPLSAAKHRDDFDISQHACFITETKPMPALLEPEGRVYFRGHETNPVLLQGSTNIITVIGHNSFLLE